MNKYPDYPEWLKINPPYLWNKYNLTVIGDRFTEEGVREHLVLENVPEKCVIANANIFTKE